MKTFFEWTPPRRALLPVLERVKQAYLLWNILLSHTPKYSRQTLGLKIDYLLLETLEWAFRASYLPPSQKTSAVITAITKLDLAKFFLQVGWEGGMLDDKQYARVSEPLVEASKMLVGWKEYLEKKTPPR